MLGDGNSFSIIFDINGGGSKQFINIPQHYGGKKWGVYLEYGTLMFSAIDVPATPSTYSSWARCFTPLPYIPIVIDSPSDKYDVNGKPLNVLDILEIDYTFALSKNTTNFVQQPGQVIYKPTKPDIKDIVPIVLGTSITISLIDITTNNPLALQGNLGNIILQIGTETYLMSGGLFSLKFIELNGN